MKTKEELLEQLSKLGVDPSKKIRKPRSDAGQVRQEYKPRRDKGQPRSSYTNTSAKYKSIYEKMLASHSTGTGDGADTLTRDRNEIFPPQLNRFYRLFRGKDREYVSSVVKPAHLEQARWRWLMAEYAENPLQWAAHISKWYFIHEAEIESWTYSEWAWSYVYGIMGEENRLTSSPIMLSYDDYLSGKYNGYAQFDERGEIVWTK
jgi:hypothetical protein